MRSVVFVEKIELDFSGNIFANALVLGDVDNDLVNLNLKFNSIS